MQISENSYKSDVLLVGPDKPFTSVAAAMAAARDGDTVLVQAGIYTSDFAEFAAIATRVTLRAVGGMVTLQAADQHTN